MNNRHERHLPVDDSLRTAERLGKKIKHGHKTKHYYEKTNQRDSQVAYFKMS
jgi:hypothetical protein